MGWVEIFFSVSIQLLLQRRNDRVFLEPNHNPLLLKEENLGHLKPQTSRRYDLET